MEHPVYNQHIYVAIMYEWLWRVPITLLGGREEDIRSE